MSERRKANTDQPYFITITVVGWIDIFTRKRYCEIILDSLDYCTTNKGMKLFAYVIMPSHLHMIAGSKSSNLSGIIRDFKRHTATQILKSILGQPGESRKSWLLHMFQYHAKFKNQNSKFMFWKKTNHPIELDYPSIYDQKIQYIQENPASAGYITDISSWYYSSSNPFQRLKLIEQ